MPTSARVLVACRVACCAFVALTLIAAPTLADDWPQWRGPNRDSVWNEHGVVDEFDSEQLEIKWRMPIGSGYSGPTVAGGRVLVMDRVVEPAQTERIHCFDEQTGEALWTYEYDCPYAGVGYTAGPRTSVSIDDGRAYALGTMGHLHCMNVETGDVVWKHDLNAVYNIDMPGWGISASPLVFEDLVIMQVGGEAACLVAFDKATGEEKWKALDHSASYSAPVIHQQGGKPVLICWTGGGIVGLNPATGESFWSLSFKPRQMVINVATPIFSDNRMFLTSFYDGSFMVKLSPDAASAEDMWRKVGRSEMETDALHSIISTPLFKGDYVYGVDSYGELRCLDAETGDRVWVTENAVPRSRWSTIHFVQNGERTWMLNERGDLIIAELSPEGYREISRAHLIDPTTDQLRQRNGVVWAHPAFANRCVFARNDKEIVCASLARD